MAYRDADVRSVAQLCGAQGARGMIVTLLMDYSIGCAVQFGVTGIPDTLMEVTELRQLCGGSRDTQPAACKTPEAVQCSASGMGVLQCSRLH